MAGNSPERLFSTVAAVRALMIKRLEAGSLGPDARREMQMALEELDGMSEELQGQARLLAGEKARYAEFFEYAPDAYMITDVGGNVREANQAALELLGAARDDVAARPLSDYLAQQDRVAFLTRAVGLMPGDQPLSSPARLQASGRPPMAVELTVRAIALTKSDVTGLCWLIRPGA